MTAALGRFLSRLSRFAGSLRDDQRRGTA